MSYDLLAPLVIAGEQSPDEAAVRERGLELLFSKKDIHNAETREAFLRLAARPERLAGFGRGLLETALGVHVAEVTAWHEAALQLFNPNLPSRILSNLAAAMCGLRLVERLCHRLGLQWGQVFPASLEECAKFLGFGVHEYLLDGGESNKTVVEQTLEVFDRMKLGPEVVHLSEDGKELGLYIKDIYDHTLCDSFILGCSDFEGAGLMMGCSSVAGIDEGLQAKLAENSLKVNIYKPFDIGIHTAYIAALMHVQNSRKTYPAPHTVFNNF